MTHPAAADVVTTGSVTPSPLSDGDTTGSLFVGGDFSTPGVGTLTIDGGSSLTTAAGSPFGNIARTAGSIGTVTVNGTNGAGTPSSWSLLGATADNGAFLTVGRSGDGTLNITDGGQVEIDSQGAPLERGPNATLGFPAGFQVARNAGSTGTVLVSGAGSELSVTSDFATAFVGGDGDAVMDVVDGGKVTFSGINSDFNVASDVGSGTGILNIGSGGSLEGPVFLNVGGSPGATGTVNLDGPGSLISLEGACTPDCPEGFSFPNQGAFLDLGANEGTGVMNVTNGARLLIDSSGTPDAQFAGFALGGSSILGPRGDGTLNVDGDGSLVQVTGNRGFFSVGRLEDGTGTLNITNGGHVVFTNPDGRSAGLVGDRPGADGVVNIDGANSVLDAGNFLGVGVNSGLSDSGADRAEVHLDNGGTLKADNVLVAAGASITGNGTIEGSTAGTPTNVVVRNGGVVSPGNSVGELVIDGDLTLEEGTLLIEANGVDDFDAIRVTGNLFLIGGVVDVLLGFALDPGTILSLFDVAGDIEIGDGFLGVNAFAVPGTAAEVGSLANFSIGSEAFSATVAAAEVPAPATIALLAAGLLLLVAVGRRRGPALSSGGPAVRRAAA